MFDSLSNRLQDVFKTLRGETRLTPENVEAALREIRLALLEASQGKIGTAVDRLVLYCFHYDSSQGRYAPMAANIMRLGGGVAVVLLAALVALLFRSDARKRRSLLESPS